MAAEYQEALCDEICRRIADGESLRAICRSDGMPSAGLFLKWVLHTPELREQYTRAREIQAHVLADETQDIVDNEPDPARARVRMDQRKWHAGKLLPKVYGDKTLHANQDGDGPPTVVVKRLFVPLKDGE